MSESHEPTQTRIVVGVDGSDASKLALRWAARLSKTLGARLDAITVWEYPYALGLAYLPMAADPAQPVEKALTQTIDEVFGAERPTDMRLKVVEGSAAQVLLHESADATMLVVGCRGHGGFAGLMLGSVSANVATHAQCPVLVVHGDMQPA